MAAPAARMRLTVDVLPLAEEDSHGPYRHVALAAFKGRKFALPVQLDNTIEQVWTQIEERYKRNYLTPAQASSFTIKVLQDAYDCDLDLSDTVSSIFEGESDPTKRLIKVIPSFVYRDFSVPFTSNLRPASAQKRRRDVSNEEAAKRRRIERSVRTEQESFDRARNLPLPSTESANSGYVSGHASERDAASRRKRNAGHSGRSKSGSVIQLRGEQTGREEFGPVVKEESPELGLPTVRRPHEPSTTPEAIRPSAKRVTTYRRSGGRPSKVSQNEAETLALLNGSPTPPRRVGTPLPHPFKSSSVKESSQTSSWMPKSVPGRGKATIQKMQKLDPDKTRPIRSSSPMVVIQTMSRRTSKIPEVNGSDLGGVDDIADRPDAVMAPKSRSPSPLVSPVTSEPELEPETVPEADQEARTAAEPEVEPEAEPEADQEAIPEPSLEAEREAEPETGPEAVPETKSRSVSGVSSTRSSPAISRRPARFLSHSPTVEKSSSEDEEEEEEEEEEVDAQPSTNSPASEASSSNSSEDDEDSEDDAEEDGEEEQAEVDAQISAASHTKEQPSQESSGVEEDSTSESSSDDSSESEPGQDLPNSVDGPKDSRPLPSPVVTTSNRVNGFVGPTSSTTTPAQAADTEQDDTESEDEESEDEESEDEDVEMPDAATSPSPSLPSPPPTMSQPKKDTIASPPPSGQTPRAASSQPLPRKTPVPPPVIPQQKKSIISNPPAPSATPHASSSQSLPRKTPVPLPGTRPGSASFSSQPTRVNGVPLSSQSRPSYKGFPSIKDQLSAARASTATAQSKKTFDPASQSLSALAKAKKGGKGLILEDSDSDDESDSESSSSEGEGPVKSKKAGCSVA